MQIENYSNRDSVELVLRRTNRPMQQSSPEIDPHTYGQFFVVQVKRLFSGESTFFATNCAETTRYPYAKK